MRLADLAAADGPDGRRVQAHLVPEGPYAGPRTLWFDTPAATAADLAPAPEGFLLPAVAAAVAAGEPRLALDAPVDASLLQGLEMAQRRLHRWTPAYVPVPVEVAPGRTVLRPRSPRRVAAFVSGGVDSLSYVLAHREACPPGHPAALTDLVFVFGLHTGDVAGEVPDPARVAAWAAQRDRLAVLAARLGLDLVTVRTNVRALCRRYEDFIYLALGPSLAAIAHLLARRLTDVGLASHGYGVHQRRYAAHLLVDSLLSSGAVRVVTGEPGAMRAEKLARVARAPVALDALQVCLQLEPLPDGVRNCGACEKCLRTRLGLAALGVAEPAGAFAGPPLVAASLAGYRLGGDPLGHYAAPQIAALRAAGRDDLADALARRLAFDQRRQRRHATWWHRAGRRVRRLFRG